MTERIRLLAAQAAKDTSDGYPVTLEYSHKFAENFAQLIVQECISINRQRLFSDYEGDSHRVAHNNALLCATSDMFEHFGVEE